MMPIWRVNVALLSCEGEPGYLHRPVPRVHLREALMHSGCLRDAPALLCSVHLSGSAVADQGLPRKGSYVGGGSCLRSVDSFACCYLPRVKQGKRFTPGTCIRVRLCLGSWAFLHGNALHTASVTRTGRSRSSSLPDCDSRTKAVGPAGCDRITRDSYHCSQWEPPGLLGCSRAREVSYKVQRVSIL